MSNPKQVSDDVFNSKSKHESAKYYFRLATIDCSNCDRAVGYATGRGPLAVISGGVSQITSGGQMIPSRSVTDETKGFPAPENSSGQWINSEPLTLMGLRGRVVLIEF